MHEPVFSEFSQKAMATDFVVMTPGMLGERCEVAATAIAEAGRLEQLFSIYCVDSDISRINRAAGGEPVFVSTDTIQVLTRAVELSRLTGGAFDVTAGPLVEAWGFAKRQGAKPTDAQIAAARQSVGYEQIAINPVDRTVCLRHQGMSINLGAIGKGYALDRIAAQMLAGDAEDFLIHGGKSSVLVRGNDTPSADDEPQSPRGWAVAIEHPLIPGIRVGGLRLVNQSLGTSGSGKQFFHHQGKRLGHVIDPRTGWPASDLLSLTIIAGSATDADALATALFVMGGDEAIQTAQRINAGRERPIGVVAIGTGRRQAEVVIQKTGIDDEAWIDEPD